MSDMDVLYSGKLARDWYDVYSSQHERVPEDLDLILKKMGCKSVIDVGCGIGRNAAGLSERGYSVFAIDASPDMIKEASLRHPNVRFACMDMRDIKTGEKFDAAILIDSCFCYMRTNDDCIGALKSISNVLRRGGTIVMHMMNMWPEMAEGSLERNWKTVDRVGDRELKIEGSVDIDKTDTLMRETSTYHGMVAGREETLATDSSPIEMRIFTPMQIDLLFRLSGFKTVGFYGDLRLTKLSKDSCDWLVAVGEKI